MKILLFSQYNAFALSLISRLDKEGHQVYVVTNRSTGKIRKPRAVFQEYQFSYDNKSLSAVVKNINPEIVILGGEIEEEASYLAGLTNILLSLKNAPIKKMIYLSSLAVFNGNQEQIIDEHIKPMPQTDQAKALLLGEEISYEYSRSQPYALHILRFSEMYGAYSTTYLENSRVAQIGEQIQQNENVTLHEYPFHHLLYIDDAADAVYKVMLEEEGYDIYHVVPSEQAMYSESDIAALFQDELESQSAVIVQKNEEESVQKDYTSNRIEALGFKEKYRLEDKIGELAQAIQKRAREPVLVGSEKESLLHRLFAINEQVFDRLLPYIENIVFFILLNVFVYSTQTMSFHETVDVYLLYIVMISLIYGFEQSIFTIVLSVLAKIYFTIYSDVGSLSLADESLYLWILFVFTIGTMVGFLKEQYKLRFSDLKDENTYLENNLQALEEVNVTNLEVKNIYEQRLLNYADSFGFIHEITEELDLIEPQAIIFKAIQVIQRVMNTEEVSMYISSGNNQFFRLIASSADPSRNLSTSLRIADYNKLFEKMERKEIYVNTELNPDYPIMAGGIYKNNHLQSIVMIWSLPFERNNLYQMNIFEITNRLIESRLNVAYEYMSNLGSSYNLKYENMYDAHSFEKIVELYQLGKEENIAQYSLLTVRKPSQLSSDDFIDRIKQNVRETDYIYKEETKAQILLANTNSEGAEFVVKRLKRDGLFVEVGEKNDPIRE